MIDPGQIADVITNPLDNAIKYADEGGQIQLIAQKSDHNVEIQVKDNGPGIPSDGISICFFTRATESVETVTYPNQVTAIAALVS